MSYNYIELDIEIEDLVEKYPQTVDILTKKGIICIQCGSPIWGTLREAINRAGLDEIEVINELNKIIGMEDIGGR